MAISDLKLPQGVSAHEFKNPVLLAEGLALDVAKQLREAIDTRAPQRWWCPVVAARWPFSAPGQAATGLVEGVVSLADERWVPVEHADSNAGLLKKYLLQGPAAKAQFLSLYSAAANLEQAAEQADRLLAELPPIDVLVLGMGDDGHTASLFPNSPNLPKPCRPTARVVAGRCWRRACRISA
jgi:6-phosphogluconolactonase